MSGTDFGARAHREQIGPLLVVSIVGFCSLLMPAPVSGSRPTLSVTILLTTATVYFVASA